MLKAWEGSPDNVGVAQDLMLDLARVNAEETTDRASILWRTNRLAEVLGEFVRDICSHRRDRHVQRRNEAFGRRNYVT